MPKVSVIVPTFNRATYVCLAIESILHQSFTDFEIIVTDDASTDDTRLRIGQFTDTRVKYVLNPVNLGLSRNYSRAMELATGEYIQFFSDDDIMNSTCLEENVKALDTHPTAGLVHSDINVIDADGNISSNLHWATGFWKKWAPLHSVSRLFPKEEYHRYLFMINNTICMPTVMIRRSLVGKAGYINNDVVMLIDLDYWLKCTLFHDVYFVNKKLVNFRNHPLSTTNLTCNGELLIREFDLLSRSLNDNFAAQVRVKRSWLTDTMRQTMFYTHYNYLRLFGSILKRIPLLLFDNKTA